MFKVVSSSTRTQNCNSFEEALNFVNQIKSDNATVFFTGDYIGIVEVEGSEFSTSFLEYQMGQEWVSEHFDFCYSAVYDFTATQYPLVKIYENSILEDFEDDEDLFVLPHPSKHNITLGGSIVPIRYLKEEVDSEVKDYVTNHLGYFSTLSEVEDFIKVLFEHRKVTLEKLISFLEDFLSNDSLTSQEFLDIFFYDRILSDFEDEGQQFVRIFFKLNYLENSMIGEMEDAEMTLLSTLMSEQSYYFSWNGGVFHDTEYGLPQHFEELVDKGYTIIHFNQEHLKHLREYLDFFVFSLVVDKDRFSSEEELLSLIPEFKKTIFDEMFKLLKGFKIQLELINSNSYMSLIEILD